ncbi:hypothetical protein MVEN_02152400 [Mycena venus]|uniref:Uncharacterized protein n=1 Tax=Mycena venus TaxID=2733690 RepID=A0A8H6XAX2_9AGAR|nr:hypothetical protein MVEN_02152400 [Mycena venus]
MLLCHVSHDESRLRVSCTYLASVSGYMQATLEIGYWNPPVPFLLPRHPSHLFLCRKEAAVLKFAADVYLWQVAAYVRHDDLALYGRFGGALADGLSRIV